MPCRSWAKGLDAVRKSEKDFWDILYGDGNPLGPRRRSILLVIIAAGILTFFVPLMTTDPPVLGRTQWSVFDLALHVCQRELPPSDHWRIDLVKLPPDPALLYLLLLFLLVVLLFPSLHRHLAAMAAIGILVNSEMWKFQDLDFERTFYGHLSYNPNFSLARHVGIGQLVLALLAVYGSVLFVVVQEDLEGEPPQKRPQIGEGAWDTREPECLDAEILSSDEEHDRANRPPRPRE
jgi:hypothetical protein